MNPREKYGEEFLCEPFTVRKADGSEHHSYDVVVCIRPKEDEASTLAYAWDVLREVAGWACEQFRARPKEEAYRIVVAWSRHVRPLQGHILKIWLDRASVCEVAGLDTLEACALRFGPMWMPLANWKKDVFEKRA